MAFNGALMTYGPNNATMFRRAGAFIDKILKGSALISRKVDNVPLFHLRVRLGKSSIVNCDSARGRIRDPMPDI